MEKYCEKYGILDAKLCKEGMVYYANYPTETITYKVIVDLNTYKQKRIPLKRYYKKGDSNMYL